MTTNIDIPTSKNDNQPTHIYISPHHSSLNIILTKIANLDEPDRNHGLKLVFKIFDNILLKYDNTSYQRLNKQNLLNKCPNTGPLWLELLHYAGFDNDGKNIIFDDTKINQLQYTKNVLTLHHWKNTKMSIRDDEKGIESELMCICENSLMEVYITDTSYDSYQTEQLICNVCSNEVSTNVRDIFWYCREDNELHNHGFNLCFVCGDRILEGNKRVIENENNETLSSAIMMNELIDINDNYQMSIEDTQLQYEQETSACNILNCPYLAIFLQCYNYKNDNISEVITTIVDSFLHLMAEHETEEEFEYIQKQLNPCDIITCDAFQRNYRIKSSNDTTKDDNVFIQIMDKIHCYFLHSYDIGNRIKHRLITEMEEKENKSETSDILNQIIDKRFLKIKNILIANRNKYNTVNNYSIMNNRIRNKFNQAFTEEIKENQQSNQQKLYHFGRRFKYGYVGEVKHSDDDDQYPNDIFITVSAKFPSLKHEMISNGISEMTIEQFNMEYSKADIHYHSRFRKSRSEWRNMKTEHILSLMIYCNFDNLQREFSKTYRINNANTHSSFYFLGMNIKISIFEFGQQLLFAKLSSFYHGVGEELSFPNYGINSNGVRIHGPLSTTTSFAVAVNFTDFNHGLVIEFGEGDTRYMEMSWLSNYANEKEFLFVQNVFPMAIKNIINVRRGFEYAKILQSLKNVQEIVNGEWSEDIDVTPLEIVIISNQLSKQFSNYKPLNSLTQYAKTMCDSFFKSLHNIYVDFGKIQQKYVDIYHILFHEDYAWINMHILHVLFPKVTHITVVNINCLNDIECAINDIYAIYSEKKILPRLEEIRISVVKSSNIYKMLLNVISTHTQRLAKIQSYVSVTEVNGIGMLHCYSCDREKFAEYVVKHLGMMYFEDEKEELSLFIMKLVINQLSGNDVSDDKEQSAFNTFCNNLKEMADLDWNGIVKGSFLFKMFYHTENAWIKLEMLNILFPQIDGFRVYGASLSKFTMDSILFHLGKTNTKIEEIQIVTPNSSSEYSMEEAVSKYNKSFESISFSIKIQGDRLRIESRG